MTKYNIPNTQKSREITPRITAVKVHCLTVWEQFVRLLCVLIELLVIAWVSTYPIIIHGLANNVMTDSTATYLYYFANVLCILGALYGIISFRTHELRVTLRETENEGKRTVTLLKIRDKARLAELQELADNINARIRARKMSTVPNA